MSDVSKKPEDLRSHRWFGPDSLRAFGHRSRARQMGYAPEDWAGKILVPYCLESKLSGVQSLLDAEEALWYQREFEARPTGMRTLLHFEAVDYLCEVFVNDQSVGTHLLLRFQALLRSRTRGPFALGPDALDRGPFSAWKKEVSRQGLLAWNVSRWHQSPDTRATRQPLCRTDPVQTSETGVFHSLVVEPGSATVSPTVSLHTALILPW